MLEVNICLLENFPIFDYPVGYITPMRVCKLVLCSNDLNTEQILTQNFSIFIWQYFWKFGNFKSHWRKMAAGKLFIT